MRKVFLEKNEITNEFVTPNTYSAWQGFYMLGYECVPFTWKQMDFLDLNKETIVNGYIRSARKAFQIIGCPDPVEVSKERYPHDLVNDLLHDMEYHDFGVTTVPSVIDVGRIRGKGWAIIETNQAWASGLYGCDPIQALKVMEKSCERTT